VPQSKVADRRIKVGIQLVDVSQDRGQRGSAGCGVSWLVNYSPVSGALLLRIKNPESNLSGQKYERLILRFFAGEPVFCFFYLFEPFWQMSNELA
jgi:hypothetical protein